MPESGLHAPERDLAELDDTAPEPPSSYIDSSRTCSQGNDDSINLKDPKRDESRFQNPQPLSEATINSLRGGLNSSPLTRQEDQLGSRVGKKNSYAPLSPKEEFRLRSIAIPSRQCSIGSESSTSSNLQTSANPRKRKTCESDESDYPPSARMRHSPPSKLSHSEIEKKYRTNLNNKIASLCESVPSLRVMRNAKSPLDSSQEDLGGLVPARKLNKATILEKAIEYITYLEKRTKCLTKEKKAIKAHLETLEASL